MRNLYYVTVAVILAVQCSACHAKENTYGSLHTSWLYSEGELQLQDTSLSITVYHRGALDNGKFIIEAPYTEGQYKLTVPFSCVIAFTLPNQTTVWINSGSTLLFDLTSTVMHLDGEALVKATDTVATVYTSNHEFSHGERGALFNISCYNDCPSEKEIETVLLGGRVIVNSRKARDTLVAIGQTAVCNKRTLNSVIVYSHAEEVISWTSDKEQYSSIPIKKLLHKMGRRYDLQIVGEERINNDSVAYISSDQLTLDKNMEAICKQHPSYIYTINGKRLSVYDVAWIIGSAHTVYARNILH